MTGDERPMIPTQSFVDIIGRLEQGDEDAARELFERFGEDLVRRARRRITGRMQSKVDAEDAAQSAWHSFFRRHREGRFDLHTWDSLLGLLVRITLRKCGKRVASLTAACRDIRREQSVADGGRSTLTGWEAVAREPTPDEEAVLEDILTQVMDELSERHQRILAARVEGYTVREIAEQLGVTERTVQRRLDEIRKKLSQQVDD